jgi:hypothetical protein
VRKKPGAGSAIEGPFRLASDCAGVIRSIQRCWDGPVHGHIIKAGKASSSKVELFVHTSNDAPIWMHTI